MNIEEAVKQCNDLINDFKNSYDPKIRVNATDIRAIETVIKELEDSRADLTTVYIKGVCDEKSRWRDKIREKIEELDKMIKDESKSFLYANYRYTMNILQELLEESD